MVCVHCNREKSDHVRRNKILWCIGKNGQYQPVIKSIDAQFLFENPEGVAEDRVVCVRSKGRDLARIDNVMFRLLAQGCTNISVNITVNGKDK